MVRHSNLSQRKTCCLNSMRTRYNLQVKSLQHLPYFFCQQLLKIFILALLDSFAGHRYANTLRQLKIRSLVKVALILKKCNRRLLSDAPIQSQIVH